ncbi:MAG: sigma-70 family RNA polymerase sigma factor [Verrucomicrobiales bacterium]|nr:sigma-70 family RNA polymerase sigma factor [Verrucomicrobiales bacterium]
MSVEPDEDAALMLRVQQGDLDAFESLVTKYRQPIFHFIYRTLLDPDETEDLAQAVFVQAWKAAPRYQVRSRFSTWLFTIARNLCLNELRRRGRHPTESLDAPVEGTDSPREHDHLDTRTKGVEDSVLTHELEAKVGEAVADLPEAQRTALLLFKDQELPYEEIGRVMGVSVSATKSLIHRARETLKRRLKNYLGTGDWTSAHGRETLPDSRG